MIENRSCSSSVLQYSKYLKSAIMSPCEGVLSESVPSPGKESITVKEGEVLNSKMYFLLKHHHAEGQRVVKESSNE